MDYENDLTPEESVLLIRSMIDKTRHNVAGNSFSFLFWGWLVFLICVLQYILMVWVQTPYHYYVWCLIWVGILVFMFRLFRKKKQEKVVTFVSESMKYLWMGLGITFFITGWICAVNGWHNSFPLFIVLYATGTFVSGRLLKFRPFVIGGILCWIIAPVTAYVSYDNQILLTALALLVSYIIPGHLLKAQQLKNQ